MIDEAKLARLEAAANLEADLPLCPTWLRMYTRQIYRKAPLECIAETGGVPHGYACNRPGRYDGDAMADILNAASELKCAADYIGNHRTGAGTTWAR